MYLSIKSASKYIHILYFTGILIIGLVRSHFYHFCDSKSHYNHNSHIYDCRSAK